MTNRDAPAINSRPPSALHRFLVQCYQDFRAIAAGRPVERKVYWLFRRHCGPADASYPATGHDVEVRAFAAPADLLQLAAEGYDLGPSEPPADATAAVYPGGKLYALFSGKQLSHFSRYISDRRDPNFGPYLPGIGGVFDICIGPCYTNPAFRGKGLYATALDKICTDAARESKETAYIYTSDSNQSSIKGIMKAGFQPFARLVTRRLLFWHSATVIPDQGQSLL